MAQENLLTPEGYEKLKRELEELKGPSERTRVAQAIREAKAHGDLRENAAYHEAKLNQTRLDSRIASLEKALQLAKIVERGDAASGVAQLGAKLALMDLEFDERLEMSLVGSFEADPSRDMISISSPLGEALLGKRAGDEIEVVAPGGTQRYRVLDVS